jgi:hypothetical protein
MDLNFSLELLFVKESKSFRHKIRLSPLNVNSILKKKTKSYLIENKNHILTIAGL